MTDDPPRVTLTRRYNAPRQAVFDAWVKPALRQRWWAAGPGMTCDLCEIDARPGGRYRINMKSPPPGVSEYICTGEFLEVVEPERLVFTWRWESWRASHADSIVTVTFKAVDAGTTEMTLVHEKLPDDHAADQHRQGWTAAFEHLRAALAG